MNHIKYHIDLYRGGDQSEIFDCSGFSDLGDHSFQLQVKNRAGTHEPLLLDLDESQIAYDSEEENITVDFIPADSANFAHNFSGVYNLIATHDETDVKTLVAAGTFSIIEGTLDAA